MIFLDIVAPIFIVYIYILYTFEHYNPHFVRIVFKCNVTDKSIKTHAKRAKLNVHRCKNCYHSHTDFSQLTVSPFNSAITGSLNNGLYSTLYFVHH